MPIPLVVAAVAATAGRVVATRAATAVGSRVAGGLAARGFSAEAAAAGGRVAGQATKYGVKQAGQEISDRIAQRQGEHKSPRPDGGLAPGGYPGGGGSIRGGPTAPPSVGG